MLIAQISDMHLRACGTLMHERFDTRARLASTISRIAALNPSPDVVLATGDLTDWGRPEDYALLRTLLADLPCPVFVIPGNHDRLEPMRDAFADQGYLPTRGDFLHYVIDDYPLRMIGLDTVLPGEMGGGLCASRLQWLADRLTERPGRPTLLFMHHPPFASGVHFLDKVPFQGADQLEQLIAAFPQVRLVACGHIHRAMHVRWAETCAAIAPSTVYQMNLAFDTDDVFSPTDDPPAMTLYRFVDGLGPVGYVCQIVE